ncbi:MAG: hypothetical protein QXU18_00350 [Thermoplasmatales archaeon]
MEDKERNIYDGQAKGTKGEMITAKGEVAYVDPDFQEYLRAKAKRKKTEQMHISGYEGMTNVPDGIYVIDFEEASEKYGDIAPLKALMDDCSVTLDFIVPVGPGMYAREDFIRKGEEIMSGLEP